MPMLRIAGHPRPTVPPASAAQLPADISSMLAGVSAQLGVNGSQQPAEQDQAGPPLDWQVFLSSVAPVRRIC